MIVDGDATARAATASVLVGSGLDVVVEASTGEEALQRARVMSPTVAVIDVSLPGMGAVTAARRLRDLSPHRLEIVAIASFGDVARLGEMVSTGTAAYVVKGKPADLIGAIRAVASGSGLLSAEASRPVLEEISRLYERERERNEELEQSVTQLQALSVTDWLTGLKNHGYFFDRLGEERAVTLAVATILVTSVWRVVGHAGEPIPPGVSGTYGFVPLEDLGVRPTIGLSALLGIVAEAASGIPFRLFLPWLYDTSVRHFGLEFDTPLDRARIREEREAIFQSGWGGAPSTRYLLDIDRAVRRAPARPSSLPPFPAGWYAVAFSDDLQPGSLESMTFCGREIVVFRTTSGRAVAMAAHCPHLGAHLGVGGQVEGETVRCPFHGFCFDETGACVSTGYGTAPPKSLAAEMFEIREIDGIVLVWHHPSDSAPTFEVTPSASRPVRRIHTMYVIRDHPQETTENSVDLGHFAHIHGYGSVAIIEPLSCDGPTLRIGYRATRVMPWSRRPIEFEFRPQVDGLGVSRVQVSVPSIDLRADLHVLPTPTDGEHVELRLALGLHPIARKRTLHPLAGLVPRSLLEWLVARSTLEAFAGDAFDDFPIWENKAYIERPRLAVGDGPIGRYRTWARQFYIEPVEHQAGGPHLVIDLTTDEDHAAVHDRANPVATAPPENPTSDGVL